MPLQPMPSPLPVILLVEDDPVLATVLQRRIQHLFPGYEAVHVRDADAALAELNRRRVPVVITDYHLVASINGLKLTAAIRRQAPETRIILISAYATDELAHAAAAQGADFYLPKPFLFADLEQIIQTVLAWWESQRHV
jgi:CheY-like chemotaxis protein